MAGWTTALTDFSNFGRGSKRTLPHFRHLTRKSGTGDFPQVTTAGVGFSGLDNIANGIFRQKNTSYNLGTGYLSYYVIGCLIYLEFVGLISIKYGALSPITQIQGLLSDKFLPVF